MIKKEDMPFESFPIKGGRIYGVRVVISGGKYGLNGCLTHNEDDHLIEFYLLRGASMTTGEITSIHGPRGYFTSRYYLSTLNESCTEDKLSLMLDGSDPRSSIDHHSLKMILLWIETLKDKEVTCLNPTVH